MTAQEKHANIGADAPAPTLRYSILHTVGTNALGVPIGFLTTFIVARMLGPQQKGAYDLVIATAALLTTMLGLSLPAGVTYVVARGLASIRALRVRLIPIALAHGAVAALVLSMLSRTKYSAALIPTQSGRSVIVAIAIAVAFLALTQFWRAILVGAQRIVEVNRLELLGRAANVLLMLGLAIAAIAYGDRPTASLFIWAYVASSVSANLWLGHRVSVLARTSNGGSSALREAGRFAAPSYMANVAQFLNYRLDLFLVSLFVGVRAVGLYALAVSLAQLIWIVSKAVAVVLLPRTAATQCDAAENALRTARASRMLLWLSFSFALATAVAGPILLPIVFGEAFRASITPLILLLPGVAVFTLANVNAAYLAGVGRPGWNTIASAVGLLVTVVLDLLLIPKFGINGAALASTFSYLASTVVVLRASQTTAGVRMHELLLITRDDLRLIRSMASSLTSRLAHR